MFENRKLVIATMHSKESVIAPLMSKSFGITSTVTEDLNTDLLGTFSGEIKRKEDALTTARNKCLAAMDLTGCDLAIASEGSFGSHPTMFFAQADDEFVLLLDCKNSVEIFGRALSIETNFNGVLVKTVQEALDFACKVEFPSHALIVKKGKKSLEHIYKGITSLEEFEAIINIHIHKFGEAWVETDMRAMFNPSRMKVIEQATQNLIDKMQSKCPSCNYPGYWITKNIKGLPCSLCGSPTQSTLAHEYACVKCEYKEQKKHPLSIDFEDPMYCNYCNP